MRDILKANICKGLSTHHIFRDHCCVLGRPATMWQSDRIKRDPAINDKIEKFLRKLMNIRVFSNVETDGRE